MLEIAVTGGFLMELYAPRKPFYFAMAVLSSTRSTTNLHTWVVADFQ